MSGVGQEVELEGTVWSALFVDVHEQVCHHVFGEVGVKEITDNDCVSDFVGNH